jgi:hypothetical protein
MKFLFLLCVFSVSVLAEVIPNSSEVNPKIMPTNLNSQAPSGNVNELRLRAIEDKVDVIKTHALEKKLKEVEANKSELVEVLKWSIDKIIILIIAIFSINWFVGWRINKQEIVKIKKNINLELNRSKLEILEDIESKNHELQKANSLYTSSIRDDFNKLTNELKSELKGDSSKLVDNFQKQLDDFNSNYRQQLTNINNNFQAQFDSGKDSSERIETSLIGKITNLDKKVDNENLKINNLINSSIKATEAKMLRVEAYMWRTRKVPRNVIMTFFDEALIYLELDNKVMIKMGLEQIIEEFKLIKEKGALSKGDIAQIRLNLTKFSDDHIALKTNIANEVDRLG